MHTPDHTSFTEARELTELAQRIITEGARAVLHCNLTDREARTWANAASWYLAALADGLEDEDDFAGMVDEFYNPAEYRWALDPDFLRDERVSYGMATGTQIEGRAA